MTRLAHQGWLPRNPNALLQSLANYPDQMDTTQFSLHISKFVEEQKYEKYESEKKAELVRNSMTRIPKVHCLGFNVGGGLGPRCVKYYKFMAESAFPFPGTSESELKRRYVFLGKWTKAIHARILKTITIDSAAC